MIGKEEHGISRTRTNTNTWTMHFKNKQHLLPVFCRQTYIEARRILNARYRWCTKSVRFNRCKKLKINNHRHIVTFWPYYLAVECHTNQLARYATWPRTSIRILTLPLPYMASVLPVRIYDHKMKRFYTFVCWLVAINHGSDVCSRGEMVDFVGM